MKGATLSRVMSRPLITPISTPSARVTSTVSGTVMNVSQSQITLQLQDGQQVALAYDQQTTVVYQNRSYQVANLERGD